MAEQNEKEQAAELVQEYQALCHAMQTGVSYSEPERFGGEPGTMSNELKHLRVGVNSSLVDSSSLAKLLIQKGLITELEYFTAIRDGMKEEVERYQEAVNRRHGGRVRITLG